MPKPSAERLIEGTLRSIAKHGMEGTTVSNIVAEAGLTRAMIMKTFGNKDALLRAAAERYCETYFDAFIKLMQASDRDPREAVRTMIRADLSENLLNADSIAILSVLRGLAHTDPEIRSFSSTRDRRLRDIYSVAIANSLRPAQRTDRALAQDLATATIAMLEGFWADYFLFKDQFDRQKAERLVTMLLTPYWGD